MGTGHIYVNHAKLAPPQLSSPAPFMVISIPLDKLLLQNECYILSLFLYILQAKYLLQSQPESKDFLMEYVKLLH